MTSDRAIVSVRLNNGEYLGADATVEAAMPVTSSFGVNAALGYFDDEYPDGASAWFDLRKPYFEIDQADNVYRVLGEVRHSGVEMSLSCEPLASEA